MRERVGDFEKKISSKRLLEEKNCMQHKCNRKLMGKKGKKCPAHQIARNKNSWWPEITHPTPPPPQELNGLPLKYLSLNNTRCSSIVLLLQIEFSFVTNPLIALLCTQKQWKRKSDSINLITTYSQYKSDTNSDE